MAPRRYVVVVEWASVPADAVAKELGVDAGHGLASAEIELRRARHGANVVVRDASRSPWLILARQFKSIIVVLLAIASAIAFVTRDAAEGAAIIGVLLINALVGFAVEWRSERALQSLRIQVRTTARVLRDGTQSNVDAEELVPGDVILLDPGAHVPADARIVESIALRVEEAALTGESVPVTKSAEPVSTQTPLADRTSMVFLGTTASAGRATAIVTATGDATELGRIGRLVRDLDLEPTPLEQRLASLGRTLVWIVLGIGAVITVAGVLRGDPLWEMIEVGISLAVAAVPEGLPAVTTLILSVGVLRMARRHAIVRKLPAVETLGSTSVICTDKTGTLTMNQLTVRELDTDDPDELLRIGVLCSDAEIAGGAAVGDPTEVALVVAAMQRGIDVAALRARHRKTREVPFDPATRHMITFHESDEGTFAAIKGAPSVIREMCDDAPADMLQRNEELASRGLRVLAFARDRHFLGFAALADPPRPGAAQAIADARDAGVRVVMLTGDQERTARAIARELNLTDVYARIAPEDKLRIVDELRRAGEIVAVTGDGVNDAPALRRADIGIAMGRTGTDAAKQTADLILTDDNLGTVVAAIEEGRTIYANITKFVHLLFSHNLGEVLTLFTAILIGWPLPLLPLQILWMNVVTDIFPAFALALEPPQKQRMHGRRARHDILSRKFLLLVAWQGTMLAAISLAAYAWALDAYGAGAHARTIALYALIAVQLGHTFNCRSRVASAFTGLFANPHLWAAVATVIGLQVLALTFAPLVHLLDLTALNGTDVLVITICTLLPIAIVELQKALLPGVEDRRPRLS